MKKIRVRYVVAGIWAAHREELTRYGYTAEQAVERLIAAEGERERVLERDAYNRWAAERAA
jgi:hypothetical protein